MTEEGRLTELILRWQQGHERGQQLSAAELCADCPSLLPEVARRIEVLRQVSRLAADSEAGATTPPPGPGLEATASGAGEGLPSVPGYEILAELGRGGMGVVYRAHEVALKRTVALKMVLAGGSTRADYRARFDREAEAAARLLHPHVVQIFARGEHAGRPYFVLEFVDGPSLARLLRGQPQPGPDAARLLLLLARAVHAAHQKGIIHRDLKPANVLLAPPADEPALNSVYGCPKIADFGVARLEQDGDRCTATGLVLGTPAYMAPEQATGKTDAIGPATDVYALGVILYELLTGRPPFKGETVLETLEQVRSHPPEPPSRMRPDVPAGLEAICLKCLQKEPGDRYPSAAGLADDLRRFLEGEAADGAIPRPARTQLDTPPARPGNPASARTGRWRLGLTAAATLVVLLAGLLVALGSHSRSAAPPAATAPAPEVLPALDGELAVRVYAPRRGKRGPRVEDPGVLPVRPGEQVRVEVHLNRPAYVYLLLLDSQGRAMPLYPWNADRLTVQDPNAAAPLLAPSSAVQSPATPGLGWRMDRHEGLETVLVLARETPLPPEVHLGRLLGTLPPTRLRAPDEVAVLRFDRGAETASSPLALNRGIDEEAQAIDQPLLERMSTVRDQFAMIRAVRFAHAGD